MKRSKVFISAITVLNIFIVFISKAQCTKLYDFSTTTAPASKAIGKTPNGDVISDGTFLYGMTTYGGTNNVGTVFKIKPDGTGYDSLINFNGINGSFPMGSLYLDGTFLYGMTSGDGTNNYGTIFKIKTDGTGFDTLMTFNSKNGKAPYGNLISDGTFLYGMTQFGSINNDGNIFKIKPDGTGFDTLMSFNGIKGSNPLGSLTYDGTYLYGMADSGGTNNRGTVFKIKPDGTSFSKLLDFNGTNGSNPHGSLFYDGTTYLYGMTYNGGTNNNGCIFKIKTDGSGYDTIMNFNAYTNTHGWGKNTNGANPCGTLISDGTYLYGTAYNGGPLASCIVFKIKTDGTGFADLLDFNIDYNGDFPLGSLLFDGTFLYGTTSSGCTTRSGTVFKIKPNGTGYTKLIEFSPIGSGFPQTPSGSFVTDGAFLYGMTLYGGSSALGNIFKIKMDGTDYMSLHDFDGIKGNKPVGSLIYDGTYLYGTTIEGGPNSQGTIFKIKTDGTDFDTLLSFNGINGSYPGGLVSDSTFLYGITSQGGTSNMGNIFKIKTNGTNFSTLLNFNNTNGAFPKGDLFYDGNSFLYGTTGSGGINNTGTIFKIKTDGTNFTTLMNFNTLVNDSTNATGAYPEGTLIPVNDYLYGSASGGGETGYGIMFKIKRDGTGYDTINRHGIAILGLNYDGTFFYGFGGSTFNGQKKYGFIFKMKPDGTGFENLYDFDSIHGTDPAGSLLFGNNGMFAYGVAYSGGAYNEGTIFRYQYCTSNCATGIIKNISNLEVNIYPNPTSGLINLKGPFDNAQIKVCDVLGKYVYANNSVSSGLQIDLNNVPNGAYFISLQTNEGTVNKKIIISH